MRWFFVAFFLLLVASGPAAEGAETEGNIAQYDPQMPPTVLPRDVYPEEIDTKTFILVEGALLIPDGITIVEQRVPTYFEVVDEDELDRFEPVFDLLLPTMLDVDSPEDAGQIIQFEQTCWRQGLKLALRAYEELPERRVRYTAFQVAFETVGHFYRARLTLYGPGKTIDEQLVEQVEFLGQSIAGVREEVGALDQTIDSVDEKISAVDTRVASLDSTVSSVGDQVSAVDGRVGSIDSQVDSLSSRLSSLESRVNSIESD